MIEIPVTFKSDGKQLVGILHKPEKKYKKGIILCHGLGGNKTENRRLFVEAARKFTRVGYATLRFDFYGSGDSEGDFSETTITTQIQNLKDAIGFLYGEGCEKICVLGLSLGAAISILTLPQKPVEALITWSAVSDFKKLFDVLAPEQLKENKNALEHFVYNGWILKRAFWNDALSHDIQKNFKQLKMSKLILQGDADEEAFVDGMRDFMNNAYPPCDFYVIPGAGHTFQGVHYTKKLLSVTTQWLKRHF